jgi:hypothetical protein
MGQEEAVRQVFFVDTAAILCRHQQHPSFNRVDAERSHVIIIDILFLTQLASTCSKQHSEAPGSGSIGNFEPCIAQRAHTESSRKSNLKINLAILIISV